MKTFLKLITVFLMVAVLLPCTLTAAKAKPAKATKAPAWVANPDSVYPSNLYITSQGEGPSPEAAKADALSKISLFFNTSIDVTNKMIKTLSVVQGDTSSTNINTDATLSTTITSQAEFFGVQWETPYSTKDKCYEFAYIKRDNAFAVYEKRIKLEGNTLESLLVVAENYDNPIYGLESAEKGLPIADLMENNISMATLVKNVDKEYFAQAESLCKRIRTAREICKTKSVFKIEVENDFGGEIKRTIGKLLEAEGYNVSDSNGVCKIPVAINVREEDLPAGIFLYGGIEVNIVTGTGEKVFSWSRNIPKTGAPKGRKEMAQKLMYQKMQTELEENFVKEFKEKVKK